MTKKLTEGWTYLINSPKWHYFRHGLSLCGRWAHFGSDYEQGNDTSPDNCIACRKKLAREVEKAK
jgi:hypothetical protein